MTSLNEIEIAWNFGSHYQDFRGKIGETHHEIKWHKVSETSPSVLPFLMDFFSVCSASTLQPLQYIYGANN
jgi:hypothetical protein